MFPLLPELSVLTAQLRTEIAVKYWDSGIWAVPGPSSLPQGVRTDSGGRTPNRASVLRLDFPLPPAQPSCV